MPGIGEITEDETVYATSIAEVFREDGEKTIGIGAIDTDDPRVREWWEEIERIIEEQNGGLPIQGQRRRPRSEPPEPHCAWYCPVHFFGHGWEIYIREGCILSHAINGKFIGYENATLAVEAGLPVYQNLNGPQIMKNWQAGMSLRWKI